MKIGPIEHPRYRVVPRDSKKLVIFFSGTGVEDHCFHWWNMGQRIDASIIYVNNGRNEWYMRGIPGIGDSYEATVRGFKAWADALGATDIFTCGGSMGGSGALIYGVPLGARVLGMGFETRLDFPWGNVQRLLVRDFIPSFTDFRPLVARAKKRIVVYAGESEPVDLAAAAYIADLPMVETITLRGVGHGPPSHLRNRGRLDPAFDAFLNDEPMPPLVNAGSGMTPGFADTLYSAYCAEREKRWGDLERWSRRAISIYPTSEYATMFLGKSLLQQKRNKEAVEVLTRASQINPKWRETRFLLGSAKEKAGDLLGAVQVHKGILSIWPTYGQSHYALGRIYAGKKSYKSALKCLDRAVQYEPSRHGFRQKLDTVRAEYEGSQSQAVTAN